MTYRGTNYLLQAQKAGTFNLPAGKLPFPDVIVITVPSDDIEYDPTVSYPEEAP